MKRGYKVNEIFHSIQGEGSTIGVNSVFVRLNGCNMRCPWCDSKFTWHDYNNAPITNIEEDLIYQILKFNSPNVVITGGEPLIEKKLPYLISELIDKHGKTIEIETNGSIDLDMTDWEKINKDKIQFNISPKLNNSSADYQMFYKNRDSINQITNNFKHIFKFVLVNESDLENIEKFLQDHNITRKDNIFIMLEGAERNRQIERSQSLIPLIIRKGYNYGARAHVLIWDTKKKV